MNSYSISVHLADIENLHNILLFKIKSNIGIKLKLTVSSLEHWNQRWKKRFLIQTLCGLNIYFKTKFKSCDRITSLNSYTVIYTDLL